MEYNLIMAKKKRTKEQKIKAGYRIKFTDLKTDKKVDKKPKTGSLNLNYFRSDLTKVAILTMLALALEIALWLILKR